MMTDIQTIEQELKLVVNQFEEQSKGDKLLAEFVQAQENYDRLVKLGLTKSRGNTLRPSSEIHLRRFAFNTKQ
jgi:hypothetical protein